MPFRHPARVPFGTSSKKCSVTPSAVHSLRSRVLLTARRSADSRVRFSSLALGPSIEHDTWKPPTTVATCSTPTSRTSTGWISAGSSVLTVAARANRFYAIWPPPRSASRFRSPKRGRRAESDRPCSTRRSRVTVRAPFAQSSCFTTSSVGEKSFLQQSDYQLAQIAAHNGTFLADCDVARHGALVQASLHDL